jgi:hypothetical protein
VRTEDGVMVLNLWETEQGMRRAAARVGPVARASGLPAQQDWQMYEVLAHTERHSNAATLRRNVTDTLPRSLPSRISPRAVVRMAAGLPLRTARRVRRCFAIAAVVTFVLAVGVGSAAAAAPQRFERTFQESDSIDCSVFNPSWTFNDDFVNFFHDRGQVWFDDAGNPIRFIEHLEHTSNDVNSVTGFTLHEHNHLTAVTDVATNTLTLSGSINIMQRPGFGEVIHTTGHKIIDQATGEEIVSRGPEMADDADFCAAIAP